MSEAFEASLPCGCRVGFEANSDEVYVRPCCDEHGGTLEQAARALCEVRGIPVEVSDG